MATQEAQLEDSRASSLSDTRVQVLLTEYEISRTNADHLEDSIWNTAAILVTGSIAGLAILGGTVPESPRPYDYLLRAAIGALSIVLIYWWKRMASVWYFIQNMLYFRIVEIEEDASLIYYADSLSTDKPNLVSGNTIFLYMKDSKINQVKVVGNAKSTYYLEEEDSKNTVSGDTIQIYMKDNKINNVLVKGMVEGKYHFFVE